MPSSNHDASLASGCSGVSRVELGLE